jgi:hypothetical protein
MWRPQPSGGPVPVALYPSRDVGFIIADLIKNAYFAKNIAFLGYYAMQVIFRMAT